MIIISSFFMYPVVGKIKFEFKKSFWGGGCPNRRHSRILAREKTVRTSNPRSQWSRRRESRRSTVRVSRECRVRLLPLPARRCEGARAAPREIDPTHPQPQRDISALVWHCGIPDRRERRRRRCLMKLPSSGIRAAKSTKHLGKCR